MSADYSCHVAIWSGQLALFLLTLLLATLITSRTIIKYKSSWRHQTAERSKYRAVTYKILTTEPSHPPGNDFTTSVQLRISEIGAPNKVRKTKQLSKSRPDLLFSDMIGDGTFAKVYKVCQNAAGSRDDVAVKIVDINKALKKLAGMDSTTQHFNKLLIEVDILNRLDHRNVVKGYESWAEDWGGAPPRGSTFKTFAENRCPRR